MMHVCKNTKLGYIIENFHNVAEGIPLLNLLLP